MYNTYLYHHGILGQKWGKKQGPPYPLSPSDHSKAEKSAGYKKSLNGGSGKQQHADYLSAHNKGEYKKDVSEMSDQELSKRLNRLRMEQQYNQISGNTKAKGEKKTNAAIRALESTNKTLGTIVKTYTYIKTIKKILDGRAELAAANKHPKWSGY